MKITKEDYLKRKDQTQAETFVEKCLKCLRKKKNCVCSKLIPFPTQTHFVFLMHPMEAKKEKVGTGRMTKAALLNSQIIMGVDFTNDSEVNGLIQDSHNACFLLYPGENALNISQSELPTLQTEVGQKRLVLFLIDGTWPCAKKMMKESKNLHQLPRMSFDVENESRFMAIKQQPGEFCLSTLESVYIVLDQLNRMTFENIGDQHEQLLRAFDELIQFQIKCASDPSLPSYRNKKGYTKKEDRKPSKRWEERSIIFK